MKRSDMVGIIAAALREYENQRPTSMEHLAERILKAIEREGMQPPLASRINREGGVLSGGIFSEWEDKWNQ